MGNSNLILEDLKLCMLIYYHKEIYTGRLIEVDLKELLVSLNIHITPEAAFVPETLFKAQ
jgi:hypothetical protein